MLRDVRISSAALGLAALVAVAASENVLTRNDSWSGSTASDGSSSSASPTVTFVSYVAVSNGILPGDASNISVVSQSDMVTVVESSDSCPYCCDPDNRSKTAWQSRFASVYNPFDAEDYGAWSPELHSSCSLQWASYVFQHFKTADWGTFCNQNPMTVGNYHTPDWATAASAASQTWFIYDPDLWVSEPDIDYMASPPCCGTDFSGCRIIIGDALVYQWPVSDKPPTISTLVNANRYTFIYPSIYIAFQTLYARQGYCQLGTDLDQATTFGFDPDLLSTANSYVWNSTLYPITDGLTDYDAIEPVYTQFNASQSITCRNITTMLYKFPDVELAGQNWSIISTASGPTSHKSHHLNPANLSELSYSWAWITVFGSPFPVTYNPCTPYLSVPKELVTMNPLWNGCYISMFAIHDPSSALDTSAGFSAVTSYSPLHTHPAQTKSASAGPSVSQPFATKTLAPVTYPTSSPTNDPPSPLPILKMPAVYTLGKTMTVTANSEGVLTVGTQAFPPGAQMTYSNTVLSLGPDGQFLVVGGTTTLYLNPSYLVGATTISAGGPAVTTLGKTYSVATGGAVVIDGSTETATQATQAPSPFQKIWVPAYIIDGQTLMAGGLPITSSGTVLSLDPVGKTVMVCTEVDISVFLGVNGSVETTSDIDSASGTGAQTGDEKSSTFTAMGSSASVQKTRNGANSRIEVNIAAWCGAVILGIISTSLHL